jgi:LmbE family N-acetylglucosaminyl deacetylase
MARILAISAHYDDVEIACGGTLLKHREADDSILIAITTSGDPLAGEPVERLREQLESCKKLGALLFHYDGETEKEIIQELDMINADTIYIPYCKDTHQDHIKAFEIGKAIGRRASVKKVFQYISPTSFECYPNYFKSIDYARKENLISVFKTQIDRRPDYLKITEAQNRLFGLLSGTEYAEGFNIIKYVEIL